MTASSGEEEQDSGGSEVVPECDGQAEGSGEYDCSTLTNGGLQSSRADKGGWVADFDSCGEDGSLLTEGGTDVDCTISHFFGHPVT